MTTFAKVSRRDVEALAQTLEPALAAAVLDALDTIRDRATLEALAAAIAVGDTDAIVTMVGLGAATGAATIGPMQVALRNIVVAGAATVKLDAPGIVVGTLPGFDMLNPRTADFIRRYELNLIRQINDATKDAIRDRVTAGLRAGKNPRQVASEVKGSIGLTTRQARAVASFRAELEQFHTKRSAGAWNLGAKISRAPGGAQVFAIGPDGKPLDGITARRLRDFRYDKTLARALETGKPLTAEQIDKMVAAYERKYLKHRAETIARTEALRALHVGAQAQWQQAVEAGTVGADKVRRKWLVARDERTCPVCSPIPKMNPDGVGLDEPFDTPQGKANLPPIHPDCRCTVSYTILPASAGRF